MRWLIDFLKSSIGAKMLMAITGIGLVLFAIAHMLGNLQVFLSASTFNAYAKSLQSLGPLLWVMRGLLLAAVVIHIAAALRLAAMNRAARPVSYARKDHRVASYAGRTMVWSGIIVFGFIAFHLAHYTLYLVTPEYKNLHDSLGRHDVYAMVVHGFSNVGLSVLYIISVGLLCAHLSHGIPSFFQSLGLRHPKYTPAIEASGPIIAVLLFLGYAAVPVGVMAKWVTLAGGAS